MLQERLMIPARLALVLLALAAAAAAQDVPPAAVSVPAAADGARAAQERLRDAFRRAWNAVAAGEPLPADVAVLRDYALWPYLEAAQLQRRLARTAARDAALEQSVQAFLEAQAGATAARGVRRERLLYFGRTSAWRELLAAADGSLEPVLQCYVLQARVATGAKDARDTVYAAWISLASPPLQCRAPFAWVDVRERLADEDIVRAARFAARNGSPLPRTVALLPPAERALALFEQRLFDDPRRALARTLAGENLVARESLTAPPGDAIAGALLEAFDRVARRDSFAAAPLYQALHARPGFSPTQRAQLERSHALGLAYDHGAESLELFERLPPDALDAVAHEWRLRMALWYGQWKRARHWLAAMPQVQQQEPRWRYWRARTAEQLGDVDGARSQYEDVAQEREFYGFLAAERAGHAPKLRPQALPVDPAAEAAIAALPAMIRARELVLCGLPEPAAHEWRDALAGLDAERRAQAVRVAEDWGWYDLPIKQLSELQRWDDLWLRFPLPYADAVAQAARDSGVPADWLYTVMRTETLYNPRAESPVGALGLMQLRPLTARRVARSARLPTPSRADLLEPATNLRLGARYLAQLHQRFGARWIFTLAAFNAGPERLAEWRAPLPLPADIWVEAIPYTETRGYVQRALSSWVMTRWRLHGEPGRLLPLLPVLAPPGEDGAP
ncbi:MAG TPA: transglycosylase SLT domain-containing protein [Candidatus Binatia bacterium]|nr:transglycosylase SLT domain-containing protein [Candidatus Binatia bacterium]